MMVATIRTARHPRRAFTLIEILVVVAIISLLSAILFPVFTRARENSRRTSCAGNLKQMALGMTLYAQDSDERLPPERPTSIFVKFSDKSQSSSAPAGCSPNANTNLTCAQWYWPDLIFPYVKSAQVFNDPSNVNRYFDGCRYISGTSPWNETDCSSVLSNRNIPWVYQGPYAETLDPNNPLPSASYYRRARDGIAYGYNQRIGATNYRNSASGDLLFGTIEGMLSTIHHPSETLLIAEAADYRAKAPVAATSGSRGGDLIPRHFDGVNIAFADGHVKWFKWDLVARPSVLKSGITPEQPEPGAPDALRKLWLPDYSSQN